MKSELFIEFNGNKTNSKNLVETTKEIWKNEGNRVKDIESIEMFFKPEENKCYYVINSTASGSFDVN